MFKKKMFKKKTMDAKVIISTEIEQELYIKYMRSKGVNVDALYVEREDDALYSKKEYPIMVSIVMIEESKKKQVKVFRKIPPLQGIFFYKVIKKSFVSKLIKEKDERVANQKRMKIFLSDIPNTKGYELMQSAVDKNAHKIQTLHFAIDLFFGKNDGFMPTRRFVREFS